MRFFLDLIMVYRFLLWKILLFYIYIMTFILLVN